MVKYIISIKLYNVILVWYTLSIDVTVQVLKENVGKNIMIKLKGDKVLNDATEYKGGDQTQLGNILLKGDNIIIISPQE